MQLRVRLGRRLRILPPASRLPTTGRGRSPSCPCRSPELSNIHIAFLHDRHLSKRSRMAAAGAGLSPACTPALGQRHGLCGPAHAQASEGAADTARRHTFPFRMFRTGLTKMPFSTQTLQFPVLCLPSGWLGWTPGGVPAKPTRHRDGLPRFSRLTGPPPGCTARTLWIPPPVSSPSLQKSKARPPDLGARPCLPQWPAKDQSPCLFVPSRQGLPRGPGTSISASNPG
ncbi:uncharacterized protein LOC123939759 [Meles meles]|uniref:uncharacterized protein LOC123939759 n=1 Tax=Meles meles TaxID=9662 RepID=UPI001E69BB56|nr:uncharacterized protein LOC123939759 [Meles meles]